MAKFRVGDRVKIKYHETSAAGYVGTGTIVHVDEPQSYAVETDTPNRYKHSCNGLTPSEHGIWLTEEYMELLTPTPMEIVNDYQENVKDKTPFDIQVGGGHYKSMSIQPVEFILANELGFCEGNIIKYTCRYKQKGGIQDLKKVIHYAEMLIADIENKA